MTSANNGIPVKFKVPYINNNGIPVKFKVPYINELIACMIKF